jgi:hypothetical protein
MSTCVITPTCSCRVALAGYVVPFRREGCDSLTFISFEYEARIGDMCKATCETRKHRVQHTYQCKYHSGEDCANCRSSDGKIKVKGDDDAYSGG